MSEKIQDAPGHRGSCSSCLRYMLKHQVAVKDQKHMAEMMNPEYILERLHTSGGYTFFYGIQNQEGNVLDKSMTITPVDLRLKRVCLAITDVTDILAAERQSRTALEKALELAKEASHAKSTFLTSMSHDIRTPIDQPIQEADDTMLRTSQKRFFE